MDYKTYKDFDIFGECQITVEFDFKPDPYEPKATITKATLHRHGAPDVELVADEYLNIPGDGFAYLDDEIAWWAQERWEDDEMGRAMDWAKSDSR